jgi:hypothetical protein
VRVNTPRVTSEPWFPVVISDGGGHATVVWEEWRDNDGDSYAQKLDAGGNRLWAADVRVNFDVGTASEPDVSVDSSGSVIVVWEGYYNGSRDIYAQKLDRDGERVWGIDAAANFYEEASQHSPSVAIDGNGIGQKPGF